MKAHVLNSYTVLSQEPGLLVIGCMGQGVESSLGHWKNQGKSSGRENIGLSSLLIFLPCSKSSFFSSLQGENFLSTKVVSISASLTIALDSDKISLFSPAFKNSVFAFPPL